MECEMGAKEGEGGREKGGKATRLLPNVPHYSVYVLGVHWEVALAGEVAFLFRDHLI